MKRVSIGNVNVDIHTGDALSVLRGLEPESVHCCVTSPPYWGLRSYLPDGHADKAAEAGAEPTPEAYVENLVAVFREVRRVLRKDGTLWLNLGDSYNGSGGAGGDYNAGGLKDGQPKYPGRKVPTLKPKDLVGIPWSVAFALRADGWYLRSEIIWNKPNPIPESVRDRPTRAHEQVFLLSKSARYFYDGDAIAEPLNCPDAAGIPFGGVKRAGGQNPTYSGNEYDASTLSGRNKRTVWTVTTRPFKEAHFATFPPKLIEPCILAGTSAKGCCPECGAPWARVVERRQLAERDDSGRTHGLANQRLNSPGAPPERGWKVEKKTAGWQPTCECGNGTIGELNEMAGKDLGPVPCAVLDLFFGAGTTGLVAVHSGRSCIGIELNAEYADMAARRIRDSAPLFAEVSDER